MIRLSAANVSRCYFLSEKKLEAIVRFILKSVGISEATLSIAFVTDSEIKRLNYLYRGRKKPTDVLSFSMGEGKPVYAKASAGRLAYTEAHPFALRASGDRSPGKRLKRELSILGDIAISVDRAEKQARRFNSTFKREICLYIIHGILHLVGYGDERPSALKRMRLKETKILDTLLDKTF